MRVFAKNSNIFRVLSEAVSEGLIVVNRERIIVAANQKTDIMFDYIREDLLGKSLDNLIPKTFSKVHDMCFDGKYNTNSSGKIASARSLYGLRSNKNQFPVEVTLCPFTIYDITYVLVLVVDKTEIKKKDIQIHELNSHLEKTIKTRTLELRETVAMLKKEIKRRVDAEKKIQSALKKERELNELKTKFLSLVSHEFKTPLSGILTSATLVGKYTEKEHQDKRDKHLNTIIGEVKHLNGILTDFLSIERLEKGKEFYRFSDFSLSKVVNEVVYNANMLLKSGQHINYPQNIQDIIIHQDEKIVTLILNNLLYNSVKYSPENSTIDILIDFIDDKMVLAIKDRGIGIPKKDQKHIFERYFRAENVLLNHGTGIGLNIIKGHIENLSGKIHFKSRLNSGSTFTVELPINMDAQL